ncbi:MAG: ApaG domain [Pseudomonadota bacterium]
MYEEETRGIRVSVEPNYLEKHSDPDEGRFVWSYTVRIDNFSSDIVQLRTRYWRIVDAEGLTEEVEGEGVVGEQPVMIGTIINIPRMATSAPVTSTTGRKSGIECPASV